MHTSHVDNVLLPRRFTLDEENLIPMCSGDAREEDADLLLSVANQIEGRTICAFGEAAAWPTQSFVKKFRKDFLNKAKTQKRKKDSLQLI